MVAVNITAGIEEHQGGLLQPYHIQSIQPLDDGSTPCAFKRRCNLQRSVVLPCQLFLKRKDFTQTMNPLAHNIVYKLNSKLNEHNIFRSAPIMFYEVSTMY
jgi:hypothetical protein